MFFFLWEGGRFVWKVPPKKLEGVLEGKLEGLPIILEGLPIIGRSSNILSDGQLYRQLTMWSTILSDLSDGQLYCRATS